MDYKLLPALLANGEQLWMDYKETKVVEWSGGAVVGRSMASSVSALSGGVANGHQTVHSVSSTPSKIPYGGFSPVRLQTGCQPRPSWPKPFIRDHSRGLDHARLFRSGTFGPSGTRGL
jgi:hypothetical protein